MTQDASTISRLAIRNTVWLTLFSYLSQFVAFGAMIVLTRNLDPQVFGLFAIGMFWSSLLNLREKFGLGNASLRQPILDGELMGTYYFLDLIIALGSFGLSILAAVLLVWVAGYEVEVGMTVVILSFANNITAFSSPMGMALERELQLGRVTLILLISTVIAYGVAIGLVFLGAGIWSLWVINVVTMIITTISVYFLSKKRVPHIFSMRWRFSRSMMEKLLKQGIPVGLSGASVITIVNQYDNFLIGTFVSPTTLGYYDRAYRISQWPNIFLAATLHRIGFLTFVRVQDDVPRLAHTMRLTMWALTTLSVPIALVLSFGASEIVHILYGPAWSQSAIFLQYLAVYSFFSPFIGLSTALAYAIGNIRITIVIPLVQALSIIVFATPLTLWFGAEGTIIGVGITIFIGFSLSCFFIFRQLPLTVLEVFGTPLLAGGVTIGVMAWVINQSAWLDLSAIIRLIIIGLIAGGGYILLLFVMRFSEMMTRINYLIKTFRGAGIA